MLHLVVANMLCYHPPVQSDSAPPAEGLQCCWWDVLEYARSNGQCLLQGNDYIGCLLKQ